MFVIAFPVFLLCFVAGGIKCGLVLDDRMEEESTNNTSNWGCGPDETECLFGCCPIKDGKCCLDGYHCCPQGQTCIPLIGICISLVDDNGQVSLESEKSTPLRNSVLKCPPNMTECAPNMCCPYKHGVCCEDKKHCCPNGTRCDLPNKKCIRDHDEAGFEIPLRKMSKKPFYKSCPDGRRMCPNYMSCCVKNNGDWGCCPNPSLPQILYGGGQCCDTIIAGNMCCPDNYPVCSPFGCTK